MIVITIVTTSAITSHVIMVRRPVSGGSSGAGLDGEVTFHQGSSGKARVRDGRAHHSIEDCTKNVS
jgi:hypothetical protein